MKTIGRLENYMKRIGKSMGKWENHRKTIGKWLVGGDWNMNFIFQDIF